MYSKLVMINHLLFRNGQKFYQKFVIYKVKFDENSFLVYQKFYLFSFFNGIVHKKKERKKTFK